MQDTFETQFGKKIESSAEKKETKEAETDPELQAAATLERADYLVKEVKSSKQQMQNIMLHMQQVQQAIKQIRAQLQITATTHDASVLQDETRIKRLQEKIKEYKEEIVHMREDLIRAQIQELKKTSSTPEELLQKQATHMVDALIAESTS